MLFTLLFNVLSHALTQLLVMTLCQSGFVYQIHVFLSFFFNVSDHCLDLTAFIFMVS